MSGAGVPVVKKQVEQCVIFGDTLAKITQKIAKEVEKQRYWLKMLLVPDSEKIVIMMVWDPSRKSKWKWLDSLQEETCPPGDFPPVLQDHPARPDGSAVLVSRSFCIPLSVTSYIEVRIGGRCADPGDRL